jgi:hypothetical protein
MDLFVVLAGGDPVPWSRTALAVIIITAFVLDTA